MSSKCNGVKFWVYATVGAIVAPLICMIPAWPDTQTPIALGNRLELFVDDYLVERLVDAELRMHHPVPAETVFRFDQPWEGPYCGYVTVIKDRDKYRMYYRGLPEAGRDGSSFECTCYAESNDGIAWIKPRLGLFDIFGNRENNVILHGVEPLSHNFAPFLDNRPGVSPDERFKALAGTSSSGLVAFVSPDGIRWRKMREEPVITRGALDSQNVAFWSESENAYLCYLRTWTETEFGGFRTISRCTSPDFLNWSDLTEMSFGETPREHLYTNQTVPYFRAPHLYIATAARFMPGRRVISDEVMRQLGGSPQYAGDCSDTVLLTSRGGSTYDRTFMEAFIRPGIGVENWTSRSNYPARGVVPTGPNEMSVYVQRNYGQTSHSLQRFTLRTDGFASLHAGYGAGELVTKLLTFDGNRLVMNCSTSAAGGIRVEMLDADGRPIAGFSLADCDEIIGDEIERTVTWKGSHDIGSLSKRPIALRLRLKDADVFSIRFL